MRIMVFQGQWAGERENLYCVPCPVNLGTKGLHYLHSSKLIEPSPLVSIPSKKVSLDLISINSSSIVRVGDCVQLAVGHAQTSTA